MGELLNLGRKLSEEPRVDLSALKASEVENLCRFMEIDLSALAAMSTREFLSAMSRAMVLRDREIRMEKWRDARSRLLSVESQTVTRVSPISTLKLVKARSSSEDSKP